MCHHNYLTYASALCNSCCHSCCHTVRVRPAIVVSYPGHFIEYFNVINRMFSLLHLCYSLSHRAAADMHFVIAAISIVIVLIILRLSYQFFLHHNNNYGYLGRTNRNRTNRIAPVLSVVFVSCQIYYACAGFCSSPFSRNRNEKIFSLATCWHLRNAGYYWSVKLCVCRFILNKVICSCRYYM